MQRGNDTVKRRKDGFSRFTGMTTGVRVLSRLQLPPELLARFRPDDEDPDDVRPDVVFYTGCNLLKTPHIALLCFDIMDDDGAALPARRHGRPVALLRRAADARRRPGDVRPHRLPHRGAARQRGRPRADLVPDLPGAARRGGNAGFAGPSGVDAVLCASWRRGWTTLRPLLRHIRCLKRVGLHEHPGVAGVSQSAEAILRMIPGLEFVDLAQPRVGYMCNMLNPLPEYKRQVHREQLQAAADAGVTTLAGIYHACHRELCSHERDWPFEVGEFSWNSSASTWAGLRPDLF